MNLYPRKIQEALNSLDPDRIYVENMRSVLGSSTKIARLICKLAVRKGYFTEHFAVVCKNDDCNRIIKSYYSREEIPKTLSCEFCKLENQSISTFESENLEILTYYSYSQDNFQTAEL